MPRTKEQCERIKEERKAAIKSAGLRLFAINGYKSVTIDDIMDEINSAHSLFYHYYPSKEELFHEIMRDIEGQMTEEFSGIYFERKAVTVLDELLQRVLHMMKQAKGAYAIYILLTLYFQRENLPRRRGEEPKYNFWNVAHYLINKGQEEGDFFEGDVDQYCVAILAIIRGLAYKGMLEREFLLLPDKKIILNLVLKRKETD